MKHMAGMRDRLIHDYMGVNYNIVWDEISLPKIIAEKSIIKSTGESNFISLPHFYSIHCLKCK